MLNLSWEFSLLTDGHWGYSSWVFVSYNLYLLVLVYFGCRYSWQGAGRFDFLNDSLAIERLRSLHLRRAAVYFQLKFFPTLVIFIAFILVVVMLRWLIFIFIFIFSQEFKNRKCNSIFLLFILLIDLIHNRNNRTASVWKTLDLWLRSPFKLFLSSISWQRWLAYDLLECRICSYFFKIDNRELRLNLDIDLLCFGVILYAGSTIHSLSWLSYFYVPFVNILFSLS